MTTCTLDELIRESKRLWIAACEHDGIDPTSMFVVFSDDNPFEVERQEVVRKLLFVGRCLNQ